MEIKVAAFERDILKVYMYALTVGPVLRNYITIYFIQ